MPPICGVMVAPGRIRTGVLWCRDAVLNLGILNDLYLADGGRALDLYERYLQLSPGGDATVAKWVVELRSRTPQSVAANRKGAS